MKKVISVILVVMAIMSFTTKEKKATYSGHWVSAATENLGNGTWGYRDFNISEKDWQIKFTMYFDSAKTIPVFTFRGVGKYEITGTSASVDGAEEAIFHFSKKYITLHITDTTVIKNFGFNYCNLTANKEEDISSNGCSFLASVKNAPLEYDIISLKGKELNLGARPADNNLGKPALRPTKLGYVLVKSK